MVSNRAKQGAHQTTGKGQPGDRGSHCLASRGGLEQAQALSGSGLMLLLATDEGFEIRHSISWATDW